MKAKLIFILFALISSQVFSQTDFSQQSAEKFLKFLASDIGPRTMGSPAERKAMKYALDKFKSFGCDTAFIQKINKNNSINTSSGNVIGVRIGATNKIIVIGGHLDTASPEVPGANDNASGSAVVLELARILSKRNNQSTLVFILFGGEEQGLVGSEAFIDYMEFEGFSISRNKNNRSILNLDSIMLMLNVDMANGLGDIEIDPHGKKFNAPKWLVKSAIQEFYKLGYKNLIYAVYAQTINNSVRRSASSDHETFINNGIPALDFTTDINTPIHTPQDNLENFDPRGLKRSGDLVLKLVEKFDAGTPSRNVEEYWIYLLGKFPVFLPIWTLKVFISFAFVFAIYAILLKRQKRLVVLNAPVIENSDEAKPKPKGKFSGLKVLILSIIPPLLGMFSFYIIGWLKNLNHPWYADPFPYLINAFLYLIIGFWFLVHIAKFFSLTKCPYSFFLKSALILIIFLAIAVYLDTKLAIYPAASLILVSMASLFKNNYIKISLFVLSPLPILKLIFNEWFYFTLRMYVLHSVEIPGRHTQLFVHAAVVGFFTFTFLPFILAFGSIYRESSTTQNIIKWFKSAKVFTTCIALIVLINFYLYLQPSYTQLWKKPVLVKQTFDLKQKKFVTTLRSPEYLNSIKITYQNRDTIINTLEKEITLIKMDSLPINLKKYNFEIKGTYINSIIDEEQENNYKIVEKNIIKKVNYTDGIENNDSVLVFLNLNLNTAHAPYKFDINLKGYDYIFQNMEVYNTGNQDDNLSGWKIERVDEDISKVNLHFYSFPDVPLNIVFFFGFKTMVNNPVKFDLKVFYNTPLYPVDLSRENTNFIFRSEIIKEEEIKK